MISKSSLETTSMNLVKFRLEEITKVDLIGLAHPMKYDAPMHDSDNLCELWHKQFGQLHYGALPLLKDLV
jgi:hypothetical protein